MRHTRLNDLADIKRLAIVCDDCGRRVVWDQHQVAAVQVRFGVRSTVQLGTRLNCKHCMGRGHNGHNASIYVDPMEPLALEGVPI